MALTEADAKQIWTGPGADVVEINKWDNPVVPVDADNPTWRPHSVLEYLYRGVSELLFRVRSTQSQAAGNGSQLSAVLVRVAAIEAGIAAIEAKVDAIAAAVDTIVVGGVDEAALGASVADQLAARLQA